MRTGSLWLWLSAIALSFVLAQAGQTCFRDKGDLVSSTICCNVSLPTIRACCGSPSRVSLALDPQAIDTTGTRTATASFSIDAHLGPFASRTDSLEFPEFVASNGFNTATSLQDQIGIKSQPTLGATARSRLLTFSPLSLSNAVLQAQYITAQLHFGPLSTLSVAIKVGASKLFSRSSNEETPLYAWSLTMISTTFILQSEGSQADSMETVGLDKLQSPTLAIDDTVTATDSTASLASRIVPNPCPTPILAVQDVHDSNQKSDTVSLEKRGGSTNTSALEPPTQPNPDDPRQWSTSKTIVLSAMGGALLLVGLCFEIWWFRQKSPIVTRSGAYPTSIPTSPTFPDGSTAPRFPIQTENLSEPPWVEDDDLDESSPLVQAPTDRDRLPAPDETVPSKDAIPMVALSADGRQLQ